MEQYTAAKRRSNRNKLKIKKIKFILFLIFIFIVTVFAGCSLFKNNSVKTNEETGKSIINQSKVNILILGVDSRDNDVGRSDTTFLITIDMNAKKIYSLSIPRDSRVKITGHGWDKINHAYAFGGSKLAKEAVENLVGISIDYTLIVSFNSFINMINALGGITVDVDKAMYYSDPYDDNGGLLIDLKPGIQRMDGKTAIKYVRYRDDEGDIGRVGRQQKFLKAVLQEVSTPQVIVRLPELMKEFSSSVKTDIPTKDMLLITKVISEAAKNELNATSVEGTPIYIQEVSYWIPNISELRQQIALMQGITPDSTYNEMTKKLVSEYEKSIPKEIKVPSNIQALRNETKQDKSTDPKSNEPVKFKVEVVNANGQAGLGAKVATMAKSSGFDVEGVSNSTTLYKNTTIIVNRTDSSIVDKLKVLPFKYILQMENDSTKDPQITIIMGKDYTL